MRPSRQRADGGGPAVQAGLLLPMTTKQEQEKSKAAKQERFLDAVRELGTIRAGARAASVPRRTARCWIERDPAFRERYEEAMAEFRDSLEERLLERIERGNGATLRFKVKGELPEKYGEGLRRGRPESAPAVTLDDLEMRAAEEEGNG